MAILETPRILEDNLDFDESSRVDVVACYDGSQQIW